MISISKAFWICRIEKVRSGFYWSLDTEDDIGEDALQTERTGAETFQFSGDAINNLREYLKLNNITNYKIEE